MLGHAPGLGLWGRGAVGTEVAMSIEGVEGRKREKTTSVNGGSQRTVRLNSNNPLRLRVWGNSKSILPFSVLDVGSYSYCDYRAISLQGYCEAERR